MAFDICEVGELNIYLVSTINSSVYIVLESYTLFVGWLSHVHEAVILRGFTA